MQSITSSLSWTCIAAIICSAGARLLTQDDYTLYFDEYHFDWSNGDDWHVITADNTQHTEGKAFTKIVACTLHIEEIKKNLCVHTKAEGGFTLKFQDFPHLSGGKGDETQSNSAHIDLENEFEAFLKSQYTTDSDDDFLNDIELDFLNDDDWSEVNAIWKWNVRSPSDIAAAQKTTSTATNIHSNVDGTVSSNGNHNIPGFHSRDNGDFGAHPQHRSLLDGDMYSDYNGYIDDSAYDDAYTDMGYGGYYVDDYNAMYNAYLEDYYALEDAIDEEFLFGLFKKGAKALKSGAKKVGRGGKSR